MRRRSALTRRRFLKGAAAAIGAPYALTSAALGAAGVAPASERITLGAIGLGGQGRGVMGNFLHASDVQVVAVCDVNGQRRDATRQGVEAGYAQARRSGTYRGCASIRDFRELTARADIDAVLVATPDHGHALCVLHAARSGKDIYCEKPLSLTVAEGRAMSDACRRHGRIFQHGTQQGSDRRFRLACQLARNGRLGKLRRVIVAVPGGRRSDYPEAQPVPDWFDYDLWLGPSPWAPFSLQRVTNGYWYHTSDYTAGFVSGWGVHHIDIAQWALGTEHTGPVEIDGRGDYPTEGLCDAAVTWHVTLRYANGAEVIFTDNGRNPQGVRFEGDGGWVFVRRGFIDAGPKSLLGEPFGPNDVQLYQSPHHARNFIDCIRTRRPTAAPVEVGHRSNTICLISDIAMRLERKLHWDPASETFGGDAAANRMLSRAVREPWRM
jgi:predicted dehydrogenase